MVSKQIQTIKKIFDRFLHFFIMKNKNVLTLSRKDNLACDSNKSNETLSACKAMLDLEQILIMY